MDVLIVLLVFDVVRFVIVLDGCCCIRVEIVWLFWMMLVMLVIVRFVLCVFCVVVSVVLVFMVVSFFSDKLIVCLCMFKFFLYLVI